MDGGKLGTVDGQTDGLPLVEGLIEGTWLGWLEGNCGWLDSCRDGRTDGIKDGEFVDEGFREECVEGMLEGLEDTLGTADG